MVRLTDAGSELRPETRPGPTRTATRGSLSRRGRAPGRATDGGGAVAGTAGRCRSTPRRAGRWRATFRAWAVTGSGRRSKMQRRRRFHYRRVQCAQAVANGASGFHHLRDGQRHGSGRKNIDQPGTGGIAVQF